MATTWKARVENFAGVYLIILAILPIYVLVVWHRASFVSVVLLSIVVGAVMSLVAGFKMSFVGAPLSALAFALAVEFSNKPGWAALFMAIAAFFARYLLARHDNVAVSLPLTFVALWLITPPIVVGHVATSWTNVVAVGVASCLALAWGACLGGIFRAKRHLPDIPGLSRGKAAISGIMTAIVFAPATLIILHHDIGQGGFWFLLTIIVVFQPFAVQPWIKAVHRALGTLLGFAIAYAITWILPVGATSVAYVVPALGFLAVGFHSMFDPKSPYWVYSTFLTVSIVLFEGSTTATKQFQHAIRHLDHLRLEASLIGIATALAMTAITIAITTVSNRDDDEISSTAAPIPS